MEPIIPKNGLDDWYAGVLVISTRRRKFPSVRDPFKRNPQWKLPGGKKEPGETPRQTALRELRQETGVELKESDLILIHEEDKWNHPSPHTLFIFMAIVDDYGPLLDEGDEGEEVDEFDLAVLPKMAQDPTRDGFFPPHWKYLAPVVTEALS